jgi:hypothetical protein
MKEVASFVTAIDQSENAPSTMIDGSTGRDEQASCVRI